MLGTLAFYFPLTFTLYSWGGSAPVLHAGWQGNADVLLKLVAECLQLESKGKDPFLFTSQVPSVAKPVRLEFRLKSMSVGRGQVFWQTEKELGWHPKRSVSFDVSQHGQWADYSVPFTPEHPLTQLRLDPSTGPGALTISGLRLVDNAGTILKQWLPLLGSAPAEVEGESTIRGKVGDSEIVITTTSRLAGAIHSLTWQGKEFIDSFDHGRQLQSACSFHSTGKFHAEAYNPTEAGSRRDGAGSRSSSRLLHLLATENALQTTSQLAYWLAPGEESEGHPARNTTVLSHYLLTKRVQVGYKHLPNVLSYQVTFHVPVGSKHTLAQFEALTGYMPAEFAKFKTFNATQGTLDDLSDGPGEQPLPVVFSTEDNKHALGIYSPSPGTTGVKGPGFGRFRFPQQKVTKWNCVYRVHQPSAQIAPGEYTFHCYVCVGSSSMVRTALVELHKLHERRE